MAYDIEGFISKILNEPTYRQIFNICCDKNIKKSGNMIIFTDLFIPETVKKSCNQDKIITQISFIIMSNKGRLPVSGTKLLNLE